MQDNYKYYFYYGSILIQGNVASQIPNVPVSGVVGVEEEASPVDVHQAIRREVIESYRSQFPSETRMDLVLQRFEVLK